MRKFLLILLFSLPAMAQIPPPQIGLTGNLGCSGFPCVNSGTLIFASDADRTMTAQETSAPYIKVASSVSLTATRNLIAPAGRFPFSIENATTGGQEIQIIGASGTGVTIPNGQASTVWNDGTNYISFGSSGGGLPAGPSFAVNFANSAVNAFQGDPNITINPTTHSLNAPVLNGVVNPVNSLNSTCASDVHVALQNAINSAGTDFYLPPGCYNVGAVGITIPSSIVRFEMSPGAQLEYSGTGTCVAITGNGIGDSPTQYTIRESCVNTNFAWVPNGIVTAITYGSGLTVSGTSGTCPLTGLNNGSSGVLATINIISSAVSSISVQQGGIDATTPPTTGTVGACTGGVTVSGTIAFTSTLNGNFATPPDTTSVGLSCTNCYHYDIHESNEHFWTGFQLIGNNAGSTENRIYPGNNQDNLIGMSFDIVGSGWTNQNTIDKGEFRINSGATCPGGNPVLGSTYVLYGSGSDNTNLMLGTELEGACVQYALDVHGQTNVFMSVRLEGTVAGGALFESDSTFNAVYNVYTNTATYSPVFQDNGKGNAFYGDGWWQDFHNASTNTIQLTDSDTIPAATYTGGLSPTGAAGTTCLLTYTGGSPNATGYVTLTSTNTIATPATVTMTATGQQYGNTPVTSATGSNGGPNPATGCAGTASVTAPFGKSNVLVWNPLTRTLTVGDISKGVIGAPTLKIGAQALTSTSSSGSQVVTCPPGGTGTQYCDAGGVWTNPSSSGLVASVAPTLYSGTSSIGTTAFPISSVAGAYRVCGYIDVTVAATAGTIEMFSEYTGDGQAHPGLVVAPSITAATQWTTSGSCQVFYTDASTNIFWYMTLTGVTGTPTFRYWVTLEAL